jgi:hypothetical protein
MRSWENGALLISSLCVKYKRRAKRSVKGRRQSSRWASLFCRVPHHTQPVTRRRRRRREKIISDWNKMVEPWPKKKKVENSAVFDVSSVSV